MLALPPAEKQTLRSSCELKDPLVRNGNGSNIASDLLVPAVDEVGSPTRALRVPAAGTWRRRIMIRYRDGMVER